MRTANEDLTTRARVRDAAIEIFGAQGFTAGVRAVATAAGVSPGLVNHHFGSKDGLRAECDAHVLRVIAEMKRSAREPAAMMQHLAEIEQHVPLVAYIVRSFAAGGSLADSLFERMVADTAAHIAEGVADGLLRPSRDPDARARFMTRQSIGGLLLYVQMAGPDVDFSRALAGLTAETTLPALELYTHGIFADSAALDAYLEERS